MYGLKTQDFVFKKAVKNDNNISTDFSIFIRFVLFFLFKIKLNFDKTKISAYFIGF
jgi:hypothetical protein